MINNDADDENMCSLFRTGPSIGILVSVRLRNKFKVKIFPG